MMGWVQKCIIAGITNFKIDSSQLLIVLLRDLMANPTRMSLNIPPIIRMRLVINKRSIINAPLIFANEPNNWRIL